MDVEAMLQCNQSESQDQVIHNRSLRLTLRLLAAKNSAGCRINAKYNAGS